jgi:hypothetical protein
MSHSLHIGQRVILKIDEFQRGHSSVQFTITGFAKYDQYDVNGNQLVNILVVDRDLKFTPLSVHFTLLKPIE